MVPVLHTCPVCRRLYQLDPRVAGAVIRPHYADPFGDKGLCPGGGRPPLTAERAGLVVHWISQRAGRTALACCGKTPVQLGGAQVRVHRFTGDRLQVTCQELTAA